MEAGHEQGSDFRCNLGADVKVVARADLGEICVFFPKDSDDRLKSIFSETRVKKVSSTTLSAFSSINKNLSASLEMRR